MKTHLKSRPVCDHYDERLEVTKGEGEMSNQGSQEFKLVHEGRSLKMRIKRSKDWSIEERKKKGLQIRRD